MISRKLWDGDKIILVSDGVLDAMPGAEKEQTFRDFLDGLPDAGVQETAEMILTFALSFEGEPRDDMTVLVGGIYQNTGRIWKWKLPSEGGFTDLSVKEQVKNFID